MASFAVKVKKLYDGSKDKPVRDVIVVVEAGKIRDVLKPDEHEKLQRYNAPLTDHSDKYMTPGLFDVHTHLMFPGNGWEGEELLVNMTPGEMQMLALKNAMQALRLGVTTLRDTGSAFSISHNVRKFINAGHILGPDLFICGRPLTRTGGHVHYMGGEADGEQEIRKLVRTLQKEGVDFIKLMATSGGTAGVRKGNAYTKAEYEAAIAESHKVGLKISMHATDIDGVRAIADLGIDGMEHCHFTNGNGQMEPDQKLAGKLARNGIYCCATIPIVWEYAAFIERKPESEWTPFERSEHKRVQGVGERLLAELSFQLREGVTHVTGSDAGWRYCRFGHGLLRSLELMGSAGMSNLEIINAATALPAKYVGAGDRLGSVREGFQADFLLLDEDPGDNISNFRKLYAVYKRGRLVEGLL